MADYRYCTKCGVEYNATNSPSGHQCNPVALKQIAQAEADNEKEVRESAKDKK